MSEALVVQQSSMARRDELSIEEMVAQVDKIHQVMARVMKEGEHYGVIPGTSSKPSLFKPGAEKLCTMFRLAPDPHSVETYEGKHLTVKTKMTLTHIPTGEVWGSGEGSCSTKETKYAYRQGRRLCPKCGKDAIIKGKEEYGGGWVCFKKKDGCGAKWTDGAVEIEGQSVDRVANEDMADQYNTVLKMANKRALVAAVLNVTAASDIFTQDLEDLARDERGPSADGSARARAESTAAPSIVDMDSATATEEDIERNTLIAEATRLSKILKLTPTERNAFKAEFLAGAEVFDADVSALSAMVAELRKRAPK